MRGIFEKNYDLLVDFTLAYPFGYKGDDQYAPTSPQYTSKIDKLKIRRENLTKAHEYLMNNNCNQTKAHNDFAAGARYLLGSSKSLIEQIEQASEEINHEKDKSQEDNSQKITYPKEENKLLEVIENGAKAVTGSMLFIGKKLLPNPV